MNDYHHGDLKQALVDAGVKVLKEEGVKGFSVRKVAKRIGVSHTACYRHYRDKDTLLAAIAEQGFILLYEKIKLATDYVPVESFAQIYKATEAYLIFGIEHKEYLDVMFGIISHEPHPRLAESAGQAFQQLVQLIEACNEVGLLKEDSSLELAFAVWPMLHGLTLLIAEGHIRLIDDDPIKRMHASLNRLLKGIALD